MVDKNKPVKPEPPRAQTPKTPSFYPSQSEEGVILETIRRTRAISRNEVPIPVTNLQCTTSTYTVGQRDMVLLVIWFTDGSDPLFAGARIWIKGYTTNNLLSGTGTEAGKEQTLPFHILTTTEHSPVRIMLEPTGEAIVIGVESMNSDAVGSGLNTMPTQALTLPTAAVPVPDPCCDETTPPPETSYYIACAQLPALVGDVSTPAGSCTTAIGALKVTNAMLAGSIDLTTKVTGTLPVANGGTGVTASTGTVAVVLSTSPTLVTPLLGTPTSGTLTNCLGLPAAGVVMPTVGAPTINTLDEDFNTRGSSGVVDGTLTYITAASATTIDVAVGEGYLRTTNDQQGVLKLVTWPASLGITIPAPAAGAETTRFVGVEYNSGTPQVTVRTTFNWNWYDDFPLGRVTRDDTATLKVLNAYAHAEDTASLTRRFLRLILPFQREAAPEGTGGLELGESGTRKITLSAGNVWHGFNRYVIAALDTNVSGSFDTYYRAVSGFTHTTGVTQWPNTQYDDGSGTLQTLTANKYVPLWFYLDIADGSLDMLYGRGNYTSVALAQAEAPPTLPDHLTYQGKLIARFIIKKSASTATVIESKWPLTSSSSGGSTPHTILSTTHSDTTGIGSEATGDLLTRNGSSQWTSLAVGTASQVLHGGTTPSYSAIVNADITAATIDLTTKVTGVLPPANGGVANVSAAGLGYFFTPTITPPTAVTTMGVITANQVRLGQFVLPFIATVTHITFSILTLFAGGLCDVGLYDSTGAKVISTGAQTTSATGVFTITVGSVTLNPGIYYAAWTTDNGTARLQGVTVNVTATTGATAMLNNQSAKAGQAANASVAGVLPATTGVITAQSTSDQVWPMILFEP